VPDPEEAKPAGRLLRDLLQGLPAEPSEAELRPRLQAMVQRGVLPVVAIDDDPTGVQTVYDTPVLLEWTDAELNAALESGASSSVVFLLTNSRSLPGAEAESVNRHIGVQLARAQVSAGKLAIVSRSDSTLRGHYPGEVLTLEAGLGETFDGHLLVPAFFEGGRYTIDDIHWVATPDADSQSVIAASDTPFARDATFGFTTAYLPAWVEEKSHGRVRADQVESVSLTTIRLGPSAVSERLMKVHGGRPVVVNAAGYGDLTTFVIGLLDAEARGKRFLYRTAASFVRVRAGLPARPLLTFEQISAATMDRRGSTGAASSGLVVVGSHVPASTAQLEAVLGSSDLAPAAIEVSVRSVIERSFDPEAVAQRVSAALGAGQLAVLYTSRQQVTAEGDANLAIGRQTMDALVAIVRQISLRPAFVVAKGGITSHEVARRGLGARRATALGQLLPGVPVWRLEQSPGLRFAGVPYVVFPGNVGSERSLLEAIQTLR
jgi:uncharacterized protein YgbK (DUF1537 family)